MKVLYIAPTSNLDTKTEILRSVEGQTVSICDGEVDRAKVEAYLARGQYDAVHLAGHGDASVLAWSDGLIEVAQLLDLLANQKRLRFVCITACNSARTGAEIHNARHVPVIVCQKPVGDAAARCFSEVFYRSMRLVGDIHRAVEAGRAQLRVEHPADADTVVLINGDMATDNDLSDCMAFVRSEISGLRAEMREMREDMKEIKTQQPKALVIGLALLGLLLLAQIATPFLTVAAGH